MSVYYIYLAILSQRTYGTDEQTDRMAVAYTASHGKNKNKNTQKSTLKTDRNPRQTDRSHSKNCKLCSLSHYQHLKINHSKQQVTILTFHSATRILHGPSCSTSHTPSPSFNHISKIQYHFS